MFHAKQGATLKGFALNGLLAWSNFISTLDTRIKAHVIIV